MHSLTCWELPQTYFLPFLWEYLPSALLSAGFTADKWLSPSFSGKSAQRFSALFSSSSPHWEQYLIPQLYGLLLMFSTVLWLFQILRDFSSLQIKFTENNLFLRCQYLFCSIAERFPFAVYGLRFLTQNTADRSFL